MDGHHTHHNNSSFSTPSSSSSHHHHHHHHNVAQQQSSLLQQQHTKHHLHHHHQQGLSQQQQQHPNCNSGSSPTNNSNNHHIDRLKMLYPNVNENETPLPRSWSSHDKCHAIGLSQNNLRVHYKEASSYKLDLHTRDYMILHRRSIFFGRTGKSVNDAAASVRTPHPIPPGCGLYYFEVKIISKGKNGYMGIGLTSENFKMNRLPGWDKQSYGYHGDDGNSFSASNRGQSYGPTFTTDDIIGCGVNFVNNTCFYTKNGIDLGIAFRDLPSKLYPTVGLQTAGEEVDANFGQEPFKFDQIEDMIRQMRAETKAAIYDFPMRSEYGDPTTLLHKMVSSYLVHNGYSLTAEAFGRTTGQSFTEELGSIRNRQKILKLIMTGKMGQAIEHTVRSYPGLLENNKNLLFMLKCRQFIEMVNGSDIESYQNGTPNSAVISADCVQDNQQDIKNSFLIDNNSEDLDKCNDISNSDYLNDVEMENGHTNGSSCKNGTSPTNFANSLDVDEDMDVDLSPSRKYCHGFERILEFGKELSQMGQQLEKENKMNEEDRQMLEDAFSLIAYSNPWSSPLGWQLCPSKRETVCSALNSAILESMSYPWRPPLEVCVAHAGELLKVMANSSLGACAFVNIDDVFPQN
ncbi:ran-binding proteins 9/10 homolog isoform X2 [Episyrphus balteatus]|uniref:ran-binding proteins 9/10 homolog isoform X2 n=1 Tax=Episyrphus balteatus TaxID=286459 RepID=UPI0024867FD5|nr:ran-binding proteins 9/10 homolog isoform X2 [Episyrphus balteatus]